MLVFALRPWVEEKVEYGETKQRLAQRFGISNRHFRRLVKDPAILTDGKRIFSEIKPRERRQTAR